MKIKVFIENEANSNKKNIFDENTLLYKKTYEISRAYPYPYGFIFETKSGDGDKVDCFVLTDKKLKAGEIVECIPVGLMEQFETSKENIMEADHNVLAVLADENVEINEHVEIKLREFVSHAFDHLSNFKQVKVGSFLGKDKAEKYIKKCRD